jgi:Leucine-rich repeat (LRR) protein
VAGSKQLKKLNCSNNQIPLLGLGTTGSIVELDCSNNKLFSLTHLSNNPKLTSLICHTNELTDIAKDIQGLYELNTLIAYSNRLKTLSGRDMSDPNTYTLQCGKQTSDGTKAQTLSLSLRGDQQTRWEQLKTANENENVTLIN